MILQLIFYPVGCSCQWFFVFRVEEVAVGLKSTPALEATTEVVLSLSQASVCITGVITSSMDQNPWTKPMVTLHTSEPVFCSLPREILTSQVSSYLGMASWVSPEWFCPCVTWPSAILICVDGASLTWFWRVPVPRRDTDAHTCKNALSWSIAR